jgi:hypothetical protein
VPHVGVRQAGAAAVALAVAAAAAGCGGAQDGAAAPATTTVPARAGAKIVPPPPGVKHVGGGELGTQTSLGGVPVPFSPELFRLVNLWGAKRSGIYIEVYAGAPGNRPARGGLIVNWTNPKTGQPSKHSGLYLAPRGVGPLTLEDVRGDRVYFAFVGGGGTFDLGTRRFAVHFA